MKKKLFLGLLVFTLIFIQTGCGSKKEEASENGKKEEYSSTLVCTISNQSLNANRTMYFDKDDNLLYGTIEVEMLKEESESMIKMNLEAYEKNGYTNIEHNGNTYTARFDASTSDLKQWKLTIGDFTKANLKRLYEEVINGNKWTCK